jgi:hypothetical protein
MAELNPEGRKANAAQPLGERAGIQSKEASKKTARRSRRAAGPDGPDARETASKQDGLMGRGGDPSEGRRR